MGTCRRLQGNEKILPKPVENKWKISLEGSFRRDNPFTGVSQSTSAPGLIRPAPSIGSQKTCLQVPDTSRTRTSVALALHFSGSAFINRQGIRPSSRTGGWRSFDFPEPRFMEWVLTRSGACCMVSRTDGFEIGNSGWVVTPPHLPRILPKSSKEGEKR